MREIEILEREHENILNFTNILENNMMGILDGKDVDVDFLRECISFIREYADKHHHQKEENILFKEMLENLGDVSEKLIRGGMLVEHDQARFTTLELENALNEYEISNSTKSKLAIISNAANYCYLLRRHATKENNVVYPFAEKNLPEDVKNKIDEEIEESEKDTKSIEERYRKFLAE